MGRSFFPFRSAGRNNANALPTPDFTDGLKELYRPESPTVDICFVHGLTGDREKTWTADGQSESWPKTLLPGVLPNARILTFGYDAYIVKKGVAGMNGLAGHATNLLQDLTRDRTRHDATSRPLIFVVHSLGGLVCKTALLASRDSPEEYLCDVFNSAIGIAFMGTPHRGSWMADWANIPVTSLGFFKSKNSKLLDVLRTDNQFLEYVRTTFTRMLVQRKQDEKTIEVACFYEEQPLPVVGEVVTKDSATMDDRLNYSIPANHMNMVRFSSVHDVGFDRLLGELQRWTGTLDTAVTLSPKMAQIREDCLASLQFSDMDMRSGNVDEAMAGTCDWLLGHEQYRRWIDGQGLLLIKGKPGSGKSTLLKHAWSRTDTGDGLCLTFFFHGRGSKLQKTPIGFLRSLSHQLLNAAPFTVTDLIDAYQNNHTKRPSGEEIDAKAWVWAEQDLKIYLTLALPKILASRPVWLFVDALDESGEEPNDLFQWLQELLNKARSGNRFPCRFFASCRPFPVILVEDGAYTICTEHENARDIAAYVSDRFQNKRISADIRDSDIPSLVVMRASGVFLWAHWVTKEILSADLRGKPVSFVRSIVKRAPDTLMALYAKQIEVMKDDQEFINLMCWVCFSEDPLPLYELRWAIAMSGACKHESLRECKDAGDVLPLDKMVRHIHSVSGGLLEITLTTRTRPWYDKHRVQFIHHTTKEFMHNTGLPALLGIIDLPAEVQRVAHFRLAKACVRYLAMGDCHEDGDIFNYAIFHWMDHIKKCDSDKGLHTDEKNELLSLLQWPSIDIAAKWNQSRSLVHALAYCGASGLLATIMQHERTKALVNTGDARGRTPLRIATSESVVRVLLENGADANQVDNDGWRPLLQAVKYGRESMVRVLLRYGANVNQAYNVGWTPLLHAVEGGRESVVRALLEYGADVNQANSDGLTPLLQVKYESESLVRLLLEYGANVNQAHDYGWTPLLQAVKYESESLVRLLLEYGANVNQGRSYGWTPLLQAVKYESESLVRLLLEYGANVNQAYDYGWTPLIQAVEEESESIVRVLLEYGADVHQADRYGWTPLLHAVEDGKESVVQVLLENGADVHQANSDGETPMSVVANYPTNSAVRILVEKAADKTTGG